MVLNASSNLRLQCALFEYSDKVHARRDYADAIKATDKSNPEALKNSIAHQALERIAKFYEEDGKLKNLPSKERLHKRPLFIKPLVEDYFASERSIRTFCIEKKNWMFHNTANGASSSSLVYSILETAMLNNLRPYSYFKYILTELPRHYDEKGNIDTAELDYLMPWAESLPKKCRKPRRL